MDEIDELLEMLPKGSFKDKEQLQSFVSENGVEELFDGIEEGAFKDKNEFLNYFTVKKKDNSDSTSQDPELVSETKEETGISGTPNTIELSPEDLADDSLAKDIDNGKLDNRINELQAENDASEKAKEEISVFQDLTNRFKSGGLSALSGLAGVPNYINKLTESIFSDKETLDELNKLPENVREIVLAANNPLQYGLLLGSIDAQNFLIEKAEKLSEKTIKYEGNIVDDIGNGDFGKASYRVLQGATESLPSMAMAIVPGGLVAIGAGTASQKQEEQDRSGKELGIKTVANSFINGVAEGYFEKYTAGMLKPIKQMAFGNKVVAKEISENLIKTILKDIGIEATSESLTSITQDLSDKLVAGEDISMIQIIKNSIDSGIIGGAMGGGTGAAAGITSYVSTKTRSTKTTKQLNKNAEISEQLTKEIGKNPSKEVIEALQVKKQEVDNQSETIHKEEVYKVENLSNEQIKEVFEINNEINDVVKTYKELDGQDLKPEIKEIVKQSLEKKGNDLEAKKNEIVNPQEINAKSETTAQEETKSEMETETPSTEVKQESVEPTKKGELEDKTYTTNKGESFSIDIYDAENGKVENIEDRKREDRLSLNMVDENGKTVGTIGLWKKEDGTWFANLVDVNKEHRRKGLATAMYDYAENNGFEIVDSDKQTEAGKAFKENRNSKTGVEDIPSPTVELNPENTNETTPSANTKTDESIQPRVEPNVQQGQDNNIQEAVDGGNVESEVEVNNNIDHAVKEVNKGVLAWDGNPFSSRVDLGISRADVRKGEADIKKGNYNTVPAKRVIEALAQVKNQGYYDYMQGSGGKIDKIQVPLTEQLDADTELSVQELEEINKNQDELAKQHEDFFNSLDEATQNEILDNYENQENNSGEVQSDTKIGESQDDVQNKQEPSQEKQEVEKPKPNETFERKQGQKSILTRAATGGANTKITDALKKHGLDYEIENQEEAKKRAESFVKDVGKDAAIEALKNGTIQPGAELAFIYSTVIDVLESEAENATGKEKKELEDKYAKLQEEIFISFDTKAREFGRFLSALNNVYNSSYFKYNLAKQVENYKARNPKDVDASGNIPADVMERFKERDAQLKAYEKEIQDLKEKLEQAEAQQAVDNIKESVERENDKNNNKKPTLTPKKRARKNELRKKFFGTLNDITRMATLLADPEFREYISLVLEEAKGDFENFSKTVVKELGKHARKHLPELFKEAGGKGDVKLSDLGEVTIDENRKITIPKQLIRDLVESGITDPNELAQTVLDEYLADQDVTLREVRDAISGYGKTTNPTPDELSDQISEIKNLQRILSGHEDVDKGQRPKRSGYQRRPRTDKELREERILKDRMRDLPADQADIEKQWKTQLDAVKSRLKNQIRELQYQIDNKEKSRPEKQPIEYDQEAKDLVEQRNELKAILENIVGESELTPEQKIQRVEKALESSIQKLEDAIKANNLAFKEKKSVTSDKIKALKERQAALRKELNDMREASGIIEKRRNENRIKAVTKRLAELQEKRKNKDYSKKTPKELPVSKELNEIQRKYNKEKLKYDQEAYADELRKMSGFKKFWRQVVNLFGLQRILLATGELSPVFLQMGIPSVNMLIKAPVEVLQGKMPTIVNIISKTTKGYSQSKYDRDYAEMENRDNYELAVKMKVALTRTDYKMSAREEEFQSDMVTSAFKILGNSLDWDGTKKLTFYDTILQKLGKDVSGKKKFSVSDQVQNVNLLGAIERIASTYGNQVKMDLFDKGVRMLEAQGKNPIDHKDDYTRLAKAINTLTGRANLGKLDSVSPLLNAAFFSARFATSTFNKLNPVWYVGVLRDSETPWYDLTKPSVAQKLALSQVGTYIATTAAFILAIQAIAGEDEDGEDIIQIETNPTSSDFGKLKIGNIRFDPWGGHLPWVVLISRIATGKMKRSNGKVVNLGEGYTNTKLDALVQFGLGKANPTVASGIRLYLNSHEEIDGKKYDPFGNEVSLEKELEMMWPIYWQGLKEIKEESPEKGKEFAYGLAALGVLGINNQVYGTSGKALFKSYAKDSKNEMNTKRSQYLRPNKDKVTSDEDLNKQFEDFRTKHEANYKELLDRIRLETRTLSSDEIDASLKSSGYSEEARDYIASGLPPKMTLIKDTTTDNKLTTIKDRLQKKDEDKFQTIVDDVLKKEDHYNYKASEYNRYLESLYNR